LMFNVEILFHFQPYFNPISTLMLNFDSTLIQR